MKIFISAVAYVPHLPGLLEKRRTNVLADAGILLPAFESAVSSEISTQGRRRSSRRANKARENWGKIRKSLAPRPDAELVTKTTYGD